MPSVPACRRLPLLRCPTSLPGEGGGRALPPPVRLALRPGHARGIKRVPRGFKIRVPSRGGRALPPRRQRRLNLVLHLTAPFQSSGPRCTAWEPKVSRPVRRNNLSGRVSSPLGADGHAAKQPAPTGERAMLTFNSHVDGYYDVA